MTDTSLQSVKDEIVTLLETASQDNWMDVLQEAQHMIQFEHELSEDITENEKELFASTIVKRISQAIEKGLLSDGDMQKASSLIVSKLSQATTKQELDQLITLLSNDYPSITEGLSTHQKLSGLSAHDQMQQLAQGAQV